MKKSEFEKIQEKYFRERMRLEQISRGDLVWDAVARGGLEMDYHPAIVKSVNLDEDYVNIVDVSQGNMERGLPSFLTESEMLKMGIAKEAISSEYERYSEVRKKVMAGEL